MSVVIYHNPRCSKSRETLGLLRENGIEPVVVEYLKTPPDSATIRRIVALLGVTPREIMRKKEAAYRQAGADNPDLDDGALIAALVAHPILLERPIVVSGDRAVIGRPPENVLQIV